MKYMISIRVRNGVLKLVRRLFYFRMNEKEKSIVRQIDDAVDTIVRLNSSEVYDENKVDSSR